MSLIRVLLGVAYFRHPDKNRSPEAADMMASINKAYEVRVLLVAILVTRML